MNPEMEPSLAEHDPAPLTIEHEGRTYRKVPPIMELFITPKVAALIGGMAQMYRDGMTDKGHLTVAGIGLSRLDALSQKLKDHYEGGKLVFPVGAEEVRLMTILANVCNTQLYNGFYEPFPGGSAAVAEAIQGIMGQMNSAALVMLGKDLPGVVKEVQELQRPSLIQPAYQMPRGN